jgi:hypothetical protein
VCLRVPSLGSSTYVLERSFPLATCKTLKYQNKPKTSNHNKAKGLFVADGQNAPAMFFFGDSNFDVGNNQ